MNLIITSITMVDLTNKEAKKVVFSSGKNLLTSEHNHLGKSVIMKSIYYTLGAEVYYPSPIKNLNLFTYIDFTLENYEYRICRLSWSFTVYRNGELLSKSFSVTDFEEILCRLFKLEINLVGKDQSGSIVKCPPAFYYMPYYIDQENGWSTNSFSFDRMTQFDMPQRKNSFFFHLGIFNSEYVEITKRQKTNERKMGALIKENEKLNTVINTLQEGIDDTQMSFDSISLEQAISNRREGIKRILDEIAKVRNNLIEEEDHHIQLTHDKEILAKYIKNKNSVTFDKEKDNLECPRCGMIFERNLAQKMEKVYLLESLHDDYTTMSNELTILDRKIEKLRRNFSEKQDLLKTYEKTLANDQENYNAYLKSKATNQLIREYYQKMVVNNAEIESINKDNTEIRKELSRYTQEKVQTNQVYLSNLGKLLVNLDIPQGQVDENSEPGTSLVASGAYGPRCKVAQMLAFLQTQKIISPELITFPLVIDSPNVLEQDSEHLDSVMRTLLTWDKTNNQIIVASIEGKDAAYSIPNVNVIVLTNPKNHLFSTNEYKMYEHEISDMFAMF